MNTSYIMATLARQQMEENARRATIRTTPARARRTFHIRRPTWHRQAVRVA
jgi:hypothetical protein